MDFKSFETAAKDGISKLVGAVEDFFAAHPEIESDAANSLRDAANAAAPIAEHVVDEVAPPSVSDAIDAAISKVQSDADAESQRIQSEAQARIQALQDAKANAAPPAA